MRVSPIERRHADTAPTFLDQPALLVARARRVAAVASADLALLAVRVRAAAPITASAVANLVFSTKPTTARVESAGRTAESTNATIDNAAVVAVTASAHALTTYTHPPDGAVRIAPTAPDARTRSAIVRSTAMSVFEAAGLACTTVAVGSLWTVSVLRAALDAGTVLAMVAGRTVAVVLAPGHTAALVAMRVRRAVQTVCSSAGAFRVRWIAFLAVRVRAVAVAGFAATVRNAATATHAVRAADAVVERTGGESAMCVGSTEAAFASGQNIP